VKLAAIGGKNVLSFKDDSAGGGGNEPQDRSTDGGLSAARLTNQPQRLTPMDIKAHIIDRSDMTDGFA
jgi:hypothetical protein